VLAVAAVVVVGWMNFSSRTARLEQRIERLEAELEVLAPLAGVMRGYRPDQSTPGAYRAQQACGPADAGVTGADSTLAWCPSRENAGSEWLELGYAPPVEAVELRIHANFNPGAVVRARGMDDSGAWHDLWAGPGVAEPVQSIPVEPPRRLQRVKLELDTAAAPGWNEIDAASLLDRAGRPRWAAEATASSEWGR
jgi:hypothetical protein